MKRKILWGVVGVLALTAFIVLLILMTDIENLWLNSNNS